jgi:hypothetical protein
MPRFTIYAKLVRKGKKTHRIQNAPIHQIDEQPIDYQDLKTTMLDTARKIWYEHDHQTTADVTLERHLSGKYIRAATGYRQTRIRYGRQVEFASRITYLNGQDQVKIEQPVFIQPWTWDLKAEFREETGKKWEIPKVTPTGFYATLQNPKIMWTQLLTLKTSSYMAVPKNLYGSREEKHHQQGPYAATPRGVYAARDTSTIERDKAERENEI